MRGARGSPRLVACLQAQMAESDGWRERRSGLRKLSVRGGEGIALEKQRVTGGTAHPPEV